MLALFLGPTTGALWLYTAITATAAVEPSTVITDSPASQQAAYAGGWVLIEVGFAAVLLGGILLYRRLPEWMQNILSNTVVIFILLYAGKELAQSGSSLGRFKWPAVLISIVVLLTISELDLWWILNDVVVLSVATLGATFIGFWVGVPFLIAALIGLTIYDHYFANRSTAMFTLGAWLTDWRVPVIFVWPNAWRLDWEKLVKAFTDDAESDDKEHIGWGIGMADIMLPAAFVVSVAAAGLGPDVFGLSLTTWAAICGLALGVLRVRYTMLVAQRSGAGLPALTSGSLGGYLVGATIAILV